MPPKGAGLCLMRLPISASLSKSLPSTIETKRTVTYGLCKSDALTFIDDKNLSPTPPRAGFPVFHDLLDELLSTLHPQANTSKRMDRHSANVTGSNAYKKTPMLQSSGINGQVKVPVDAVTATASGALTYFLRRVLIISRRRTDLPVPRRRSAFSKTERKGVYAVSVSLKKDIPQLSVFQRITQKTNNGRIGKRYVGAKESQTHLHFRYRKRFSPA
jgi:hypothetical protein